MKVSTKDKNILYVIMYFSYFYLLIINNFVCQMRQLGVSIVRELDRCFLLGFYDAKWNVKI